MDTRPTYRTVFAPTLGFFAAFLVTLTCFLLLPIAVKADEVPINGSFETPSPAGWTTYAHAPDDVAPYPSLAWRDDPPTADGGHSVRQQHYNTGSTSMWWRNIPYAFEPGEPVLITAKVNVGPGGGAGGGRLWAYSYNDNDQDPVNSWVSPTKQQTQSANNNYEALAMNVAATGRNLRLHLQHRNYEGASRFDDVKVLVDRTKPESYIESPSDNEEVDGHVFTLEGTAFDQPSDYKTGIDRVEISTNGGVDWHKATGTEDWSYSWTLPRDGVYRVLSRAIDRSGNSEKDPSLITVTVDNWRAITARTDANLSANVNLATYNIFFKLNTLPSRTSEIAQLLTSSASGYPEVIGLQEVNLRQATRLRDTLKSTYKYGRWGYFTQSATKTPIPHPFQLEKLPKILKEESRGGNLILSQRPIVNSSLRAIKAVIKAQPGLLRARIQHPAGNYDFSVTHISDSTSQGAEVADKMSSHLDRKVLVGDFNSVPPRGGTIRGLFENGYEYLDPDSGYTTVRRLIALDDESWIDHMFLPKASSAMKFTAASVAPWDTNQVDPRKIPSWDLPPALKGKGTTTISWPSDHRLVRSTVRINSTKAKAVGEAFSIPVLPQQTVSTYANIRPNTPQIAFTASWPGSDVGLTLVRPDGRTINAFTDEPRIFHDEGATYDAYIVDNPEPGAWRMDLTGIDVPAGGENVDLTALTEEEFLDDVDITAPSTALRLNPATPDGENDWYRSVPSVTLDANDNHPSSSGLKSTNYEIERPAATLDTSPTEELDYEDIEPPTVDIEENAYTGSFEINEGVHSLYYHSSDNAGNDEEAGFQEIDVDITPPTITSAPTTEPNHNGWYKEDVTVYFDATDSVSGVATVTPDQVLSTEAASQSVVGWATDVAGNSSSTTVGNINIDKTRPKISIDVPAEGAEYLLNQVVTANWAASDSLSGVESAEGTRASGEVIDTASVGEKTFTVRAVDRAGNVTERTITYYVRYVFGGVLQPINLDGSSVFKLGSTVPVKFWLRDANGVFVGSAIAKIYVSKMWDGVFGDEIEAISTSAATTGNLFRYDETKEQYIFNLGTKGLSVGSWLIRIELDDGTSHYSLISLK